MMTFPPAAYPNLTVAVILHGEPPHIRQVIDSILAQEYTHGKITILCLDDRTSPQARQLLEAMNIRIVDLPQACSISVAKNTALRLAHDEFVLFLDDHLCLEQGSVEAAMNAFRDNPRLAGVCGFYRSASDTDWNILRDIKRHSIYGKGEKPRRITLEEFTTFSTGIGVVRRSVWGTLGFPEDIFPPDFGGEDTPALIEALNRGYEFAFVPSLRGLHNHELGFSDFLKKIEIEVRGRYSIFYWATGNPQLVVPYLHGFLNFPLLLFLCIPVGLVSALLWQPWLLLVPAALLAHECALSLRCLSTPVYYRFRDRLLAAFYVLTSDLLTPLCGLQYLVSAYRRPFRCLQLRRLLRMLLIFLKWELTKLGFYRVRARQGQEAAMPISSSVREIMPPSNGTTLPRLDMMSPARLKVSLLSEGVDFPLDAFASIKQPFYENQYVYGRTSRGALRPHRLPQAFKLGEGVISAVLRREGSRWRIRVDGDHVILLDSDDEVMELNLPERPAYFCKTLSNGQRAEDFIAVAGETTPGFFLYPDCHYFPAGMPCAFCSLRHTRKTAGREMAGTFPLHAVAEATRLFQSTPWKDIPIISISTGTFPNNDEGAIFTCKVVKSIYDELRPKIPIHVLTMPPDTLGLIELYREAGATSIAFNIEVFDRTKFAEICPGKQRFYGYDKFLRALERAAGVFGPYNAFCGFVWGLESKESLLDGYKWCFDRGISVSSNVFHADQGSLFAQRPHPSEGEILSLCKAQFTLYERYPEARTIFPMSMRSTLDWEIIRGDFQ